MPWQHSPPASLALSLCAETRTGLNPRIFSTQGMSYPCQSRNIVVSRSTRASCHRFFGMAIAEVKKPVEVAHRATFILRFAACQRFTASPYKTELMICIRAEHQMITVNNSLCKQHFTA